MEATFKEKKKKIYIYIYLIVFLMVTTFTEHTRSIIWKPLLKEIIKLYLTLFVKVTTCTEHTRSRNMEATFIGNPETIVSSLFNDY